MTVFSKLAEANTDTNFSQHAGSQSIVAKLRHETQEAHLSIEQSSHVRAIFSNGYSIEEYGSLLERLWLFYSVSNSVFSVVYNLKSSPSSLIATKPSGLNMTLSPLAVSCR
jgi:hypothetical protein